MVLFSGAANTAILNLGRHIYSDMHDAIAARNAALVNKMRSIWIGIETNIIEVVHFFYIRTVTCMIWDLNECREC